ncbi:uncharacterized protein BKA55DRAFT_596604 [Fusarium redolens]|uniref:Uncharacterized protein n=1 Tax=Fusarium redolens TaxID=48865 RepID=A0A9P9GL47_FUSRE|nr:uncharacterized protein BKA55DRAFT_596604 [Fusarium redolens]KAH7239964.1 hypothetical protein BKA55DRAFT_596604 [Fusarium redolens]
MFLELTAPASPIVESSPTTPVKDNKFLVLTPPAPAMAEYSNASSVGADVDNTEKLIMEQNAKDAELNELRAKVQALESENEELKAEIRYEKAFKEHFSKSLDEANRNWHSAELEASAKGAELGRVRERLNSVQLQAAAQDELHALKEKNTALQAHVRLQFSLTTHQHVQQLKHMMHDWKTQVEQKIDEDFEKNKAKEHESATPVDVNHERLKAMIEGHEKIIINLKKGNDKFVAQIKDLQKAENASFMADLTVERFEAFLYERKKMVTQLEEEKHEFEQKVNDI